MAPKVAIGYTYEDSNPTGNTWSAAVKEKSEASGRGTSATNNSDPAEEEESEEEVDFGILQN